MMIPDTWCKLLACGVLVYWFGYWLFHLAAICYGKYKLHRIKKQQTDVNTVSVEADKDYPGVSIIKPMVGVDPNLADNLRTYFTIDYPKYEVLLCVQDSNDPAIQVATTMLETYGSSVDLRLLIGASDVGVNPKICNMHPAYSQAKYPFVLISDSSIKMRRDTLKDMVDCMLNDVAIVHQIPFTCDRIEDIHKSGIRQRRFVATLEKVFFGTAHARIYLVADLIRAVCHTGMSSLIRKRALDECGGLSAFAQYLAEDYFIAQQLVERGWRTTISGLPALQNSGTLDLYRFHDRLRRWVKLRASMVPYTIVLEPMSECLILGAIAAWSTHVLVPTVDPYAFYLVHTLVWFLLDWILLRTIQGSPLPFTRVEYSIAWLYRECLGPYIFLTALLWRPRIIRWAARTYKLRLGGIAETVDTNLECTNILTNVVIEQPPKIKV
ncbi:ceramide glucosyltransferase-like [Adelges cooleyi]|uniref:ceramide glucosyltransferase-like n=1 Tax=Adelges cooleyi TaxID=133065 RepID=UPI00217FE645|nr:ceramide glucosyltransferase-like [Adelges cooleyi]XP_050427331.1 ceramide glucosyltransferase-like [Adelges cooleyi]